jgi:TPP-dependent pyruvate/acetoin dehydrogenase alpha subunit
MFIEALTYRVGAHSSSDDPSRYRDESVTATWKTERDPLLRARGFMLRSGLLSEADERSLAEAVDAEVRAAIAAEEHAGPPPLDTLVQDVYAEVPQGLREQLAEVAALPRQSHGA